MSSQRDQGSDGDLPSDPSKAVFTLLREPHRALTAASMAGQGFVNDMRKTADLFMRTAADLPEVRTLARVSDDLKRNMEDISRKLGASSAASLHLEDWALLNQRLGFPPPTIGTGPTPSYGPGLGGMRKSASESDFSRMSRAMVQRQQEELTRAEEGSGMPRTATAGDPKVSEVSPGITVVSRMPRFPRIAPPAALPPLEEEAIAAAAAQAELEDLAAEILAGPQRAITTAKNQLRTTAEGLSQQIAQSAETLQRQVRQAVEQVGLKAPPPRSPDLGPLPSTSAPVSPVLGPLSPPPVRFEAKGNALDMVRPGRRRSVSDAEDAQADAAGPSGEGHEDRPKLGDVTLPWSIIPGYLAAREAAAAAAAAAANAIAGVEGGGEDGSLQVGRGKDNRITHINIGPFQIPLPAPLLRPDPSIRDPGRHLAIVTTAALPWMTGTAVNPLLRAAYLAKDGNRTVTLVVPWLAPADQRRVYPHGTVFSTPESQEEYIRDWAQKRTGFDSKFKVVFYPGRYAPEKGSILAVGDITSCIPDHEADVAVLEEPEHLNWYHHGRRWTDKFRHVVGVVHTNYLDYARREEDGDRKASILEKLNSWVCRSHCHKVIKLSGAVQPMPREVTEFVHGVSPPFLRVGEQKAKQLEVEERAGPSSVNAANGTQNGSSSGQLQGRDPKGDMSAFSKGVYFIGKVVWAKGYTELLELMERHSRENQAAGVHVDVFGSGDDLDAVKGEASKKGLHMTFHGAKDHLDTQLHDYKVFVNPSTSDVVATTTAEALAMGKFAVVPDLPCNHFFASFSNCLVYRTPEEFSQCLETAVKSTPKPMSEEERHRLTWEAATDRFLEVADVDDLCKKSPIEAAVDTALAFTHNTLTGLEPLRRNLGAGVNTKATPTRVTDYEPQQDEGGFFDNKQRAQAFHAKATQ